MSYSRHRRSEYGSSLSSIKPRTEATESHTRRKLGWHCPKKVCHHHDSRISTSSKGLNREVFNLLRSRAMQEDSAYIIHAMKDESRRRTQVLSTPWLRTYSGLWYYWSQLMASYLACLGRLVYYWVPRSIMQAVCSGCMELRYIIIFFRGTALDFLYHPKMFNPYIHTYLA